MSRQTRPACVKRVERPARALLPIAILPTLDHNVFYAFAYNKQKKTKDGGNLRGSKNAFSEPELHSGFVADSRRTPGSVLELDVSRRTANEEADRAEKTENEATEEEKREVKTAEGTNVGASKQQTEFAVEASRSESRSEKTYQGNKENKDHAHAGEGQSQTQEVKMDEKQMTQKKNGKQRRTKQKPGLWPEEGVLNGP
ncbi:unnamed protein product [Amoebophrya sp. A120]|nr:unnamed protein product [Amoebophrya sp. A120]|eukprot:GSA120T00007742001.1